MSEQATRAGYNELLFQLSEKELSSTDAGSHSDGCAENVCFSDFGFHVHTLKLV